MGLSKSQHHVLDESATIPPPRKLPARVVVEEHRLAEDVGGFANDPRKSRIAGMRRGVGFAARGIIATDALPGWRPSYPVFVTLTYANVHDWDAEHIGGFLQAVRRYARSAGWPPGRHVRYVWVAEVQRRGAIHYHVMLWLPAGESLPKPDQAGWWPHGASNIQAARSPVGYLMKYLSKGGAAPALPRGARCHGCGGLEHAIRRARRWLALPGFVRARADINSDWRRASGGGWVDPDGVVIPSEYARVYVGTRWHLVRVVDYGRPRT